MDVEIFEDMRPGNIFSYSLTFTYRNIHMHWLFSFVLGEPMIGQHIMCIREIAKKAEYLWKKRER